MGVDPACGPRPRLWGLPILYHGGTEIVYRKPGLVLLCAPWKIFSGAQNSLNPKNPGMIINRPPNSSDFKNPRTKKLLG